MALCSTLFAYILNTLYCGYVQIVYKLCDLGFAKDQSEAAVCQTRLGTLFYIVGYFHFSGL